MGGPVLASFPDVVVYTAPNCFFCVRARRLLAEKGIPFRDVDVATLGDGRRTLREQTGRTSVPQIFINGDFVGGYMELAQLAREGALEEWVGGKIDPRKGGDAVAPFGRSSPADDGTRIDRDRNS
jgi:glutaredoxin 3